MVLEEIENSQAKVKVAGFRIDLATGRPDYKAFIGEHKGKVFSKGYLVAEEIPEGINNNYLLVVPLVLDETSETYEKNKKALAIYISKFVNGNEGKMAKSLDDLQMLAVHDVREEENGSSWWTLRVVLKGDLVKSSDILANEALVGLHKLGEDRIYNLKMNAWYLVTPLHKFNKKSNEILQQAE